MKRLSRSFFQRDFLTVAEELVGSSLIWGECEGIVVETEAYASVGDEACHTFSRKSTREFVQEKAPGTAYVYLNYGMYWLLNVLVKDPTGNADGIILIRALEPTAGLDVMRKRRRKDTVHALCSGPGKLGQALGITGEHHGLDLCDGPNGFKARAEAGTREVETDVRIGISRAVDFPWRFLLKASPYVSVPHSRSTTWRKSE